MAKADVVFWLAASFVFGVFSAGSGWPLGIVLLIAVPALIFAAPRLRIPRPLSVIMCIVIGIGALYFHLFLNTKAALWRLPPDGTPFTAIISREPQPTAKALRITLSLQAPYAGTIHAITEQHLDARYGDLLSFQGIIERDERTGMPTLVFPDLEIKARGRGSPLKHRLLDLKHHFSSQYERVLPPDLAALLAGLTFGETKEFSLEFKQAMRDSGTTHLTALSGYNIAILAEAVRRSFGHILHRRTTALATAGVIGLFVIMVGAEASVVRAAIMGLLLVLAGETGRIYSFRNAATLAAAAMLLASPTLISVDLGFQLSFLSLLSITYLAPALQERWWGRHARENDVIDMRGPLTTTIAAQLAVLPLIVNTFGEFSLTAVVANILILTFVPITMFFGFMLAFLGGIIAPLASILAPLLVIPLGYMHTVISLFANIRIPIATNFGLIAAVAYYTALIIIAFRPKLRLSSTS